MDLNSWTPSDKVRRLGLLLGFFIGCCTAMVLLLDQGWNALLAILTGVVTGVVVNGLTHLIARTVGKSP